MEMQLASIQPARLAELLLAAGPLLIYLTTAFALRVVGRPASMADLPHSPSLSVPSFDILRGTVLATLTLAVSCVALVMGKADLAIHLPFAVGAVAMTAGLGTTLLLGGSNVRLDPDVRRTITRGWSLLFAPAMAALVLGYFGRLDLLFGTILVVLGLSALFAVSRHPSPASATLADASASTDADSKDPAASMHPPIGSTSPASDETSPRRDSTLSLLLVIPAAVVIMIAAILIFVGAPPTLYRMGFSSELLIGSFLVAPWLIAPVLVDHLRPNPGRNKVTTSHPQRPSAAGSLLITTALFSICFVAPLVAAMQSQSTHWKPAVEPALRWLEAKSVDATAPAPVATDPSVRPDTPTDTTSTSTPTTAPPAPTGAQTASAASGDGSLLPRAIAVPLQVARVDALILVIASLLILPGSLGLFRIGRSEGCVLLLLAGVYVLLSLGAAL